MSYPAYESFGKWIGRGYGAWRVYMALQPPALTFHTAKDVKVVGLVDELHMSPRDVIRALGVLTEAGYLVEHSRNRRGVRSLTLAYALEKAA